MSSFRARSALRSWLCGVLVNVRRERIRVDWRAVERVDVEAATDTGDPDDALDLERAIGKVPSDSRR